MDQVLCDEHQKVCMLKTGVKDGPNLGKSFYICAEAATDRCGFVREASVSPVNCDVHQGSLVELQRYTFSQSNKEKRIYYRCVQAKQEKKNWCSHRVVKDSMKLAVQPLGIHKNPITENTETSEKKTLKCFQDEEAKTEVCSKEKPCQPNDSYRSRSSSDDQHSKNERTPKKSDTTRDEGCKSQLKLIDQSENGEDRKSKDKKQMKKAISSQNLKGSKHSPVDVRPKHSSSSDLGTLQMASRQPQTVDLEGKESEQVLRQRGLDDMKRGMPTKSSAQHHMRTAAITDPPSCVPKATPDFASLSLQNRMKTITLEGNESLLVSPRSGNLKYRSKIGKDESDSSDESDDDCQIVEAPPESEEQVGKDQERGALGENLRYSENQPKSTELKAEAGQIKVMKVIKSKDGGPPKVVEVMDAKVFQDAVQQAAVQKSSCDARAELMKRISQKADLVRLRESQVQVLRSVNKKVLPDGGARLERRLESINEDIEALDLEIKDYQKLASQQVQSIRPVSSQAGDAVKTVSGQTFAAGTRQTLLTDHAMQLPAHVLKQMYAANPQLNSLYGGRMTAARLREVGSVTTEAIERLHKQLATMPAPDAEIEDPDHLRVTLMNHQRQAMSWLLWREEQHTAGGILADDMGLGKTLTMISLVLHDKQCRPKAKDKYDPGWLSKDKRLAKICKGVVQSTASLVICPASIVHQWGKEVERRCRKRALKVIMYHGQNREQDVNVLAESDLVLTTYSIVGREVGAPTDAKNKEVTDMPAEDADPDSELEKSQPNLLRIAWRRVILDEAHNIKNHKSLTSMSVCRLRAGRRWALTGTPIQNDLLDMYALLRFLRCSPFDELKVWKRQVDNKSSKGQQRLNLLVKTLLLRRTKDQKDTEGRKLVALPSKETKTHELVLSAEERTVYERIFEQSKTTLENYLERAEEKQLAKEHGLSQPRPMTNENPWSGQDRFGPSAGGGRGSGGPARGGLLQQGQPGGSQILLMLLRLRQCCSHPTLMKEALDTETLHDEDGIDLDLVEQMRLMALKQEGDVTEPTVKKSTRIFEMDSESTKIKSLIKHIKAIRDESPKDRPMKSVIVSQWTQMLTVVERHLVNAGFGCATIKGNVPPKKRTDLVDAFNTDPKGPEVMLLSLRAGGVGLNLVGGNHLFLIDMHWNPALESQACDRIYRMGQTLDVHIHRFICKDTIEEKILKLQKRKTDLAQNVLSGSKASANKLTLQDMKMLFGLDEPRPTFQ